MRSKEEKDERRTAREQMIVGFALAGEHLERLVAEFVLTAKIPADWSTAMER
jgi:hypothetical protein